MNTASASGRSDSAGTGGADSSNGILAEQLLRLTRRLHRIQKRHLEPLGITPAQSRLLRLVSHYDGGEAPGWRISRPVWKSSRAR